MSKHRTISYEDALAKGLIADSDGHGTGVPFEPVTTWYLVALEGEMLNRAIAQLNGCEVLIVSRGGTTKLFRPKGQVRCDSE